MRLLHITDDGTIRRTKEINCTKDVPPYAILSHTWGGEEVTFDDLKSLDSGEGIEARTKDGWKKIDFCAQQTKRDGLNHFWVDTCCIDKTSSAELAEAINTMFRWYQNADRCYVFLPDVEGKSMEDNGQLSSVWKVAFKSSRWFSRGWTLQELLAPRSVEFFSKDGTRLGDKESLKQTINEVTKIPIDALSGSDLYKFSVTERFSWAQDRQTTREEDGIYCLLGIFGCHLALIYGEGRGRASRRLMKEIREAAEDTTVAPVNNNAGRSHTHTKRLRKICNWLSTLDPSTNYHKAVNQRQPKTGLWLLNSARLEQWKESAASRLWLHGIPGCGKTILSSTIIRHLLQYCHEDIRKVTAYFYFDFIDAQKRDPKLMLRSLLCQLLQRSGTIPKGIEELYSSCGDGQQQPSLHALLEVGPQVMRQFTHVYIVLDALDECTQRLELMEMLETITGWQLEVVHLLITSRREQKMEMSLKKYIEEGDDVSLEMDFVDKDISRYVQQRLCDDERLGKWNKDAKIRQEIETALMNGARGMFRWAVCQLDALAKCRNLAMLRKSLATLPEGLDQTYDRILTAISEEDSVYAMRILQWLTSSARPLYVEEIAEIVAIDATRETAFDPCEVLEDPLDALDICSSLVTIATNQRRAGSTPNRQIVTLAHYSVHEYLVSDRIKKGPMNRYSIEEAQCHKAIAKGCLGYLDQLQQPISEELLTVSALARYSAQFWVSHLQKAGDETQETYQLATRLLTIDNPAYLTWIRLYNPEAPWMKPDLRKELEDIATPLYYGALLGLNTIVRMLLVQGAEVNAQCGEYGNALQAASAKGHKVVVKLLIDAHADVNASCGRYGNALQAASAQGYDSIVDLLLSANAAVNAQGGYYSNALRGALAGGHETTIGMLLGRCADPGPDIRLKGAMHHAINGAYCTPSLVSMLRQHGAPLDTVDMDNMKPLHYCAKFGHLDIATELILVGVPVDSRVRRLSWPSTAGQLELGRVLPVSESTAIGLTPLHFAALIGNATMTKFLLGNGADPNAHSEYRETPLHLTLRIALLGPSYQDDWNAACLTAQRLVMGSKFQGNAATLDLILKREEVLNALLEDPRTSITATDRKGEGFLHCVRYGKPESAAFVRKLVSKGVDVSCCNLHQQTPLHFASIAGDYASVKILLSAGARAASGDEGGLNALHHAARSGDRETMSAILETAEAKAVKLIASKDKSGQNVLHHTLCRKSPGSEILQWLLDQGANGSELDNSGISPLARFIEASTWGIDTDILRSLLEIKGNASFVDHYGQTLGHFCARTLNFEVYVLEALQEYSVDLTKKDCGGMTILHCAAIFGSLTEESLKFLVNVIGLHASEQDTHGRTALHYATEEAARARRHDVFDRERWERTRDILSRYRTNHVS